MSVRSKFGITLEVLSLIESGVTIPTNILYKANLSHRTMKDVLSSLEETGLVSRNPREGNRTRYAYGLTDKGAEVLRFYEKSVIYQLIKKDL